MIEVEKEKGIGNAKIGLIVAIVIIVILVTSNILTYIFMNFQYGSLQWKHDIYVATHQYSNWEYETAQFSFYYLKPKQKFGVYDLDEELDDIRWIKPYQEGVFDCSEMSAFLERHLENEGWHAKIILGDSPSDSGRHAWLLVETSEGKYMPVESTNIEVVWWENPYFDNYWEYDYEFETIQEAIDYYESEFDWWKSP